MNKVGVTKQQLELYRDSRLAAYDKATTPEAKLNVIMRDKWVAQFGMGIEAWTGLEKNRFSAIRPCYRKYKPGWFNTQKASVFCK
jgi:hypothetical protein